MSTPYERLLAEDIPTRPPPVKPVPAGRTWTPEEQDTHWADLCHAIGAPNERRPHLRAINSRAA